MACHGDFWWRKHGRCEIVVTRKTNASNLSLRRQTINRDTGQSTSRTFGTAELEAGIGWNLVPARTYALFLTIRRTSSASPGRARVELSVRDETLIDHDCTTRGEAISGDWQVKVFRQQGAS